MISVNYFDGRLAQIRPVFMLIRQSGITLFGDGFDRSFAAQDIRVEEAFAQAPCIVSFADGSHCEIYEPAAKTVLLQQVGYRKSWVMRCQDKSIGALLAILLMLGMLASSYQWGIPWLADKAAPAFPVSLERRLGAEVIHAMDDNLMLEPSKLGDKTIQQAERLFRRLLPAQTRVPIHLEVRFSKSLGANAFALPGGTIVVTDQMLDLIVGAGNDLNFALAGELAGVFAHEIGHIEKRHFTRRLMRDAFITTLTGGLFGDFSSVVTLAPSILVQSEYSREMETEADIYAIELLRQRDISPAHLADLLVALEAKNKSAPESALPAWLKTVSTYVASHPPGAERIARFRQAAK